MKTTRFFFTTLLAVSLLTGLTRLAADEPVSADQAFAAFTTMKAAKPPAPPKEMGNEKYLRWVDQMRLQLTAEALAFFEKYPTDPRRWELVLTAASAPPHFAMAYGPDVESAGLAAIMPDEAAKAAWTAKMDALKISLLESKDAGAALREQVEWGKFGGDFRAMTNAKRKGETVDFSEFRARFDAHVAKYAELTTLAARAGDYLGALDRSMPGAAEVEWKRYAESSNEALSKLATEQLAKTARMAELKTKPIDLVFTATDGRVVDLKNLRGKVVLIDFWATWCGPCIAELPNIKKVYAAYHDLGFEIVGIALENGRLAPTDTPEQTAKKLETAKKVLAAFTTKEDMPWPQYFDGKFWQNDISTKYSITAIPAMFLIDQDGKVVTTSARGPKLEAEVKRLLKL